MGEATQENLWLIALIGAAMTGVSVWLVYYFYKMLSLKKQGIKVPGTITRIYSRNSRSTNNGQSTKYYYIDYTFETREGQTFSESKRISRNQYYTLGGDSEKAMVTLSKAADYTDLPNVADSISSSRTVETAVEVLYFKTKPKYNRPTALYSDFWWLQSLGVAVFVGGFGIWLLLECYQNMQS